MSDQAAPMPVPNHRTLLPRLPHPHAAQRLEELRSRKPIQSADVHVGINGKIALRITAAVGTMWCAYIFCVIAAIGAYAVLYSMQQLNLFIMLISQTFLQLVLLPVIIVGQNIQGHAADKRAIETYKDAEAILSECLHLQAHLQEQDTLLNDMLGRVHRLVPES